MTTGNEQSRPVRGGGSAETSSADQHPQHTNIDPKTLAAVDRASDLDRGWFKRHPARAHRVRRMVADEYPPEALFRTPLGWPTYTVVKQVLPGTRLRSAVALSRSPCTCERCAADLWDRDCAEFHPMALDIAVSAMGQRK